MEPASPRHVVLMGVSGTGKSTIGRALAADRGAVFVEGDEFHPAANVAKMAAGKPLDDEERGPWLEALAAEIARYEAEGIRTVTACSALRRAHRDRLRVGAADLFFAHLDAPYAVLAARMARRTHFMPPSLLRSQFATLEPLGTDEAGVVIDVAQAIEGVVADIMAALSRPSPPASGSSDLA